MSLLACAVGLVVVPLTASAAFPGGNGDIVFSTNRDAGNFEIYKVPSGGGAQPRLTNDAALDANPAFSPNGSKIAFSRGGSIYTMNSDGSSQAATATPAAGDNPAWSHDGTKIAFVNGSGNIVTMNADGSSQTTHGLGDDPAWSPDGTKIAFSRGGDIFTMLSGGGSEVPLTSSPTAETQPNWKPDGSKIVYVSTIADPAGDLWTMNSSDGSSKTSLTENALAESSPSWSPDGAQIAFVRTDDIYVMPAVSGAAGTQLTANNPSIDQQPDWGASPVAPVSVPTNTTLPAISPVSPVAVGTVLSTTNGTWTGSPTSHSYQWKRCDSGGGNCIFIPGATSQTYTVVAGDVNSTLRVEVTASNSAGPSTAAPSGQTAVVTAVTGGVPVNTSVPTITGTPAVGQTLISSPGLWSPIATSYAYQWKRCDAAGANCANISAATIGTYLVVAADLSQRLRVAVTASNASGSSTPPTESLVTAAVTAAVAFANTVRPVISGTPAVGQTLTTTDGTWTSTPTTVTYQWRRCDATTGACANITGATTKTYVVATADNGAKLAVVVTASHTSGTGTATSDMTATVGSSSGGPAVKPTNKTAPSVSGQAANGQTLRATNGEWNGTTPMTFAYQWQSCDKDVATCTPLTGASLVTYKLAAKDVGKRLRVRVTATNTAGSSAVASQASAVIAGQSGGNAGRKIVGTARNDKLNGTAKNDTIHGRAGNDTLNGLAGNDLLLGETGNDRLFGGAGVDGLNGGPGRDLLSGGAGNDGINAAGDGARDVVDCGAGKDRATVGRTDVVRNCETVKRKKR